MRTIGLEEHYTSPGYVDGPERGLKGLVVVTDWDQE